MPDSVVKGQLFPQVENNTRGVSEPSGYQPSHPVERISVLASSLPARIASHPMMM